MRAEAASDGVGAAAAELGELRGACGEHVVEARGSAAAAAAEEEEEEEARARGSASCSGARGTRRTCRRSATGSAGVTRARGRRRRAPRAPLGASRATRIFWRSAGEPPNISAKDAAGGAGSSLASPGGPWRSPGVGSETYVPGGTCGDALRRIFARSAGEATNISENAGASVAATSGASATCPFSRPAFGDPPPLVGVCKTEDASRARSVRALRIFASAAGEADIMSVNADGGGIARAGTARRRLRRAPRRDETRIRLIGAITCYFSRQRVSVAGAPRHRPEKASAAPATHRRTRVAASLAHAPTPPSRRRAFSRPRLGPRRHAP